MADMSLVLLDLLIIVALMVVIYRLDLIMDKLEITRWGKRKRD